MSVFRRIAALCLLAASPLAGFAVASGSAIAFVQTENTNAPVLVVAGDEEIVFDWTTIYALLHNEYQGHRHGGQCPSGQYFPIFELSRWGAQGSGLSGLEFSDRGAGSMVRVSAQPNQSLMLNSEVFPVTPGAA